MSSPLSPYRLEKARNLYNAFNAFNSLSFSLLSGNIITLYALRLGAGATMIGLLNAFAFTSFFFMPLGKRLVRRLPIIRVFASAWIARYLAMIPLLFAPWAAARGRTDIALGLMVLGVFGFHASRGIGMIGNNPVLNELAVGPDRGSYMTHIQIINSAVGMFSSFALALLLGRNPPLFLYAVIMFIGIVSGCAGSLLLYRIPEPPSAAEGGQVDFFAVSKRAFARSPFRRFIVIFLGVSLASSVARAFTIVYSREVYAQGDGLVTLFTVFGGLGALAMGLVTRLLVDRVGAKPLYITYTALAAFSLLPAVYAPGAAAAYGAAGAIGAGTVLFLAYLHFAVNFGFAGAEGVAQNYFFGLIKPQDILDLGILYYIVYGAAGAAGSFFAGLLLDGFSTMGLTPLVSYRILFSLLAVVLAVVLFLQRKLMRLGALPLRGALGVIFSFRDLRAITLLDRLDKTKNAREEEELLGALQELPSQVALTELLDRARSPRLAVRTEALRATDALSTLSPEAKQALMRDAEQNPYTTAYLSARILGSHGVAESIPLLRSLIRSEDYMLSGEAMVALARLGDGESRTDIEAVLAGTRNPRLRIMGTAALELLGSPDSVPVLLDLLREEDPPPYLRDEVTLALAGLMGIQERFYPLLVRYLDDPALVTALAMDEVDAASERLPKRRRGAKRGGRPGAEDLQTAAASLRGAVSEYMASRDGGALSRWILDHCGRTDSTVPYLMAEAVMDEDLTVHDRFRLLAAAWASERLLHLPDGRPGASA